LLFNFALDYSARKVGIKLYDTYQLLVYADEVNLLADNIDTAKESTETLIDGSKKVSLQVNAEKSKYTFMLLFRHENAG
jgi:hypothetical protein